MNNLNTGIMKVRLSENAGSIILSPSDYPCIKDDRRGYCNPGELSSWELMATGYNDCDYLLMAIGDKPVTIEMGHMALRRMMKAVALERV